jgi:hypothetical protein
MISRSFIWARLAQIIIGPANGKSRPTAERGILDTPRVRVKIFFRADLGVQFRAGVKRIRHVIAAEGSDIIEEKLGGELRERLGMPPLEAEKKGTLGRLFT